jgi:aminopeptidase YwaD
MRAIILAVAFAAAQTPSSQPIPPGAEHAYAAVKDRVDEGSAMEIVRFMDQYWRIAGNPGFNASVDHIRDGLQKAGLAPRVEEFAARGRGWDYRTATVAFADTGEVLMSRELDRVALCINSFSTPAGGTEAPLVDVGAGAAADFQGKDVKGAVVLGSASVGQLWNQAVKQRGAIGVISTQIASYIRPNDPAQFTFPDQNDVLQWGSVPYDDTAKAFGFKASLRAASKMRDRLKTGPVTLKVDIQSTFYDGPDRMVVAEIPGTVKPDERIVMVAHIQEPGANDDGSGCGTLYALAIALHQAIASGKLAAPGRTLTFIWGDENRGSHAWLVAHPDQAKGVQYMLSMDMTGEDTSKTTGTFLIEKQADPSAVWPDAADPHTAWGASQVKAEELKGSLLNDVHLAICLRRARDTGWIVKTNPYEGGSDHTEFKNAGIPSLLNWHFTDRFYHTNLDRPEKTSPAEMVNVGVSVATSAWYLASANEKDALATVDLIAAAARARLAREASEHAGDQVVAAWKKWYGEALDSVSRLAVTGASPKVDAAVASARANLTR